MACSTLSVSLVAEGGVEFDDGDDGWLDLVATLP